jgi:hypothetical protein
MPVKKRSDVAHTEELPPKYGNMCLPATGWMTKSKNALKKIVREKMLDPPANFLKISDPSMTVL